MHFFNLVIFKCVKPKENNGQTIFWCCIYLSCVLRDIIEKTCTTSLHIGCAPHRLLTSHFGDFFEAPFTSSKVFFLIQIYLRDSKSLTWLKYLYHTFCWWKEGIDNCSFNRCKKKQRECPNFAYRQGLRHTPTPALKYSSLRNSYFGIWTSYFTLWNQKIMFLSITTKFQTWYVTLFEIFPMYTIFWDNPHTPYHGFNKFDWLTLILHSIWSCRIWFGNLSSRPFCNMVSDLAHLVPFSNKFPLEYSKDIDWEFNLVHIKYHSVHVCYIFL